MAKKLIGNQRRRPAAKYAVIVALIAVASIVVVEATGNMLTGSYAGLGGKLVAPSAAPAPASSKVQ